MSSRRVCRTEDELGAIEANMPLLFLPLFVNAREPAGQVVHTCAGSVDGVLDSQIKNAGVPMSLDTETLAGTAKQRLLGRCRVSM